MKLRRTTHLPYLSDAAATASFAGSVTDAIGTAAVDIPETVAIGVAEGRRLAFIGLAVRVEGRAASIRIARVLVVTEYAKAVHNLTFTQDTSSEI